MSVLSKWLENSTFEGIASIILNMLFNILDKGEGIQIFVNLSFGKYVVDFDRVDAREIDQEALFCCFFALKGIIVRVGIKPNF